MRSIKRNFGKEPMGSDQQDLIDQIQTNGRRKLPGGQEKSSLGCNGRRKAFVPDRQENRRR